jgi:hypothetical protein
MWRNFFSRRLALGPRRAPLSERAAALIESRQEAGLSDEWVFPSATRSGHIEHFTLKKRHAEAFKLAKYPNSELR